MKVAISMKLFSFCVEPQMSDKKILCLSLHIHKHKKRETFEHTFVSRFTSILNHSSKAHNEILPPLMRDVGTNRGIDRINAIESGDCEFCD